MQMPTSGRLPIDSKRTVNRLLEDSTSTFKWTVTIPWHSHHQQHQHRTSHLGHEQPHQLNRQSKAIVASCNSTSSQLKTYYACMWARPRAIVQVGSPLRTSHWLAYVSKQLDQREPDTCVGFLPRELVCHPFRTCCTRGCGKYDAGSASSDETPATDPLSPTRSIPCTTHPPTTPLESSRLPMAP